MVAALASLARTKHAFSLLNGALVFFGAAIGIMGVYLYSDPHLSEMHGENDIGYVCWGVMSLGAALLVTAALGCKLIVVARHGAQAITIRCQTRRCCIWLGAGRARVYLPQNNIEIRRHHRTQRRLLRCRGGVCVGLA